MAISVDKKEAHPDSLAPGDGAAPPLADRVLLIEDNEEDVMQFQRLVRRVGARIGVDVVTDGETAVRWLAEKIAEAQSRQPVLPRTIFVDLHLPGMSGAEVLRWIRSQPALDRAALVVCSSTFDPRALAAAEHLGADVCVTKYPPLRDFAALLSATDPRRLRDETPRHVRRQ